MDSAVRVRHRPRSTGPSRLKLHHCLAPSCHRREFFYSLDARRAFGVKDAASKVPVDDATMFEAASMSKPVFAYAVLKLCERGVLDLDTPLTHYTTSRLLAGDPRLDLITARHVLSHTTGFANWRSQSHPLSIAFTPGTQWSYSGEGYSYLQSVISV